MTGAGAANEAVSAPSTSVTGRKVVSVFAAGASSFFQENNIRVPIPYRRATPDTDAPGRSASSTMRFLSAPLKLRRLPGPPDRAEGK